MCFLMLSGIVYWKQLPQSQNVTSEVFSAHLDRIQEQLVTKGVEFSFQCSKNEKTFNSSKYIENKMSTLLILGEIT